MWTPGPLEIVIILVIVLIIFGPKRLPDLGRSLGRGMREFKDSISGKDDDDFAVRSLPPADEQTVARTERQRELEREREREREAL